MSTIPPPPPAPPGVAPTFIPGGKRASFMLRFVGYLLDGFLYGLLSVVFAGPAAFLIVRSVKDCNTSTSGNSVAVSCTGNQINGGLLAAGIALAVVGFLVVAVVYLRALGSTGQTWGRKIMGLRVVDAMTSQPIGFARALGRTLFANIVSGAFCDLGYLWMLWDKDQQTWHDKVVNSVVLKD
jgi:uncharacterized RDD family membrane protein YckC